MLNMITTWQSKMKFIAILILLTILQVQNSISIKSPFECILGCTGACINTGFQCFRKCFRECKNGRLSDETNFLPKFNAMRKTSQNRSQNQKKDICKLPHAEQGYECKANIPRWSFDSRYTYIYIIHT